MCVLEEAMSELRVTELVSGGEGWGQAVVFNDRAAPLRVAHGANVCHAESVAGGGSTKILQKNSNTSEQGMGGNTSQARESLALADFSAT